MTFSAVWLSPEYDIPVKIIQYLGRERGEHWFLVEFNDSKTGVPLSQLKDIKKESEE